MSQPTISSPASLRFWDARHNRAVRNVATIRDGILANFKLSASEWFVLDIAHNARETGTAVGEVARIMDVQTTYIALVLRHLQAKRLVTTTPDKRDRRVHLVKLTPEGESVLAESEVALREAFSRLAKDFTSRELDAYATVVTTLANTSRKA